MTVVDFTPVCPFARDSRSYQQLACEGIIPNTTITTFFPNALNRKAHIARYCAGWNYRDCPICRALERNYGEG